MNEEESNDAPFEWLTNFRSLRHLVLPSRIMLDGSSSTSSSGEGTLPESNNRNNIAGAPSSPSSEQSTPVVKLNALHVGCGTSTVGESLLRLRERTHHHHHNDDDNNNLLQFGHVVNVDNDNSALESMKRRWEERKSQITAATAAQSSSLRDKEEKMGVMEWKCLDFSSDRSCRLAMDGVYRRLSSKNNDPSSIVQPGGSFDLVLDKSTLDCLLCAETNVVAQFLCEVYRALRVPTASSSTATTTTNPNDDDDETPTKETPIWGGLYVLVTFHPVEFVERLLTQLPGADWHVEHETIKREVEDIKKNEDWEVDEVTHTNSSDNSENKGIPNDTVSPSSSAWSSGVFNPDENYRKTVTVFTCRRCCTHVRDDDAPPSYILDREQLRDHIAQTCDEWYQETNPMVTREREEQLRAAFLEAVAAEANVDQTNQEGTELTTLSSDGVSLDLKQCYDILFTDAEREHLSYEYFIEDWDAYCDRMTDGGDTIDRGGMTVAIALDFLKEMQ